MEHGPGAVTSWRRAFRPSNPYTPQHSWPSLPSAQQNGRAHAIDGRLSVIRGEVVDTMGRPPAACRFYPPLRTAVTDAIRARCMSQEPRAGPRVATGQPDSAATSMASRPPRGLRPPQGLPRPRGHVSVRRAARPRRGRRELRAHRRHETLGLVGESGCGKNDHRTHHPRGHQGRTSGPAFVFDGHGRHRAADAGPLRAACARRCR